MYAVQLFINRKYQTVTGPSSLSGAFDNYTAHVRSRADKDAMVRLVKVVQSPDRENRGMKVVELRKAKALGLSVADYFLVSTEKATKRPVNLAVKHLVPHAPKLNVKGAAKSGRNHTTRKAG